MTHLDELSSTMLTSTPMVGLNPPKVTPTFSASQSLQSNAHFAQGERTPLPSIGRPVKYTGASKYFPTVTTVQQADEVTRNRWLKLEARGLATCPLCKEAHYYDKTWVKVVPVYTTKYLSSRLCMCPKFVSMNGEERLRAVMTHSACLYCTGWDHKRHLYYGSWLPVDPVCKWRGVWRKAPELVP